MAKKGEWERPTTGEVFSIVEDLGGYAAVGKILHKDRSSIYYFCHRPRKVDGKSAIDFANWKELRDVYRKFKKVFG